MNEIVNLGSNLVQVVVGAGVEHQAFGLAGAGMDPFRAGWREDLVGRAVDQQDRSGVREPSDGISTGALSRERDNGPSQRRGRAGLDDDGAAEGVAGQGDALNPLPLQVGQAGEDIKDALAQYRGPAVEDLERGDALPEEFPAEPGVEITSGGVPAADGAGDPEGCSGGVGRRVVAAPTSPRLVASVTGR